MATTRSSTLRPKCETMPIDPRRSAGVEAFRALPFVRERPEGVRSYWMPQALTSVSSDESAQYSTSDYGDDCVLGQLYAEAYMRLREDHAPDSSGLQHVVLDMLNSPGDARRGLIVGFFSALDHMLRIAALHGGSAHLAEVRRRGLAAAVQHYEADVRRNEAA